MNPCSPRILLVHCATELLSVFPWKTRSGDRSHPVRVSTNAASLPLSRHPFPAVSRCCYSLGAASATGWKACASPGYRIRCGDGKGGYGPT